MADSKYSDINENTRKDALSKLKDKSRDPSIKDYVSTISTDMLPFGDQIGGVAGGAGAALGHLSGSMESGKGLVESLEGIPDAFSEGREDSLEEIEESRERLPEGVQTASLGAGLLMPGGASKGSKIARLAKAKRLNRADDTLNLISKAKKSRADSLVNPAKSLMEKQIRKVHPDLSDLQVSQLLEAAKQKGMY